MKRETRKTVVYAVTFIGVLLFASGVRGVGFTAAGLALRETGDTDPGGFPSAAKIIPTGVNLAVLWLDNRADPERFGGTPTLQMVAEDGTLLLGENGVSLGQMGWCPDVSAYDAVPDGSGGLFVCASDEDRPGTPKVVQRYTPAGEPFWEEPLLFEDLLLFQAMEPLANGGTLCLFSSIDPALNLARIEGDGTLTEWTIASEPVARSGMPVGIVPRVNGFLVIGRIIYSANSSDLRRVMLDSEGEPDWNPDGSIFYYGRVNNSSLIPLDGGRALLLVSGENFNLLGQFFSPGGVPLWEFGGLELLPGEVIESSACDASDGFWLEARRTGDDYETVSLQRFSSVPEPLTEEIILAEETVHAPLADPVADGAGGVFTVHHSTDQLQPVVTQFDESGVVRDGYEPPLGLDSLAYTAEVAGVGKMWGDFIVAYSEDRYDSGRSGLYLQRFSNAAPNSVPPGRNEPLPDRPDLVALYPNPFNGVLTLEVRLDNPGQSGVTVFDLLGRLVLERSLPASAGGLTRLQLELGGIPSGMYYLRVTTGGETLTKTITLVR